MASENEIIWNYINSKKKKKNCLVMGTLHCVISNGNALKVPAITASGSKEPPTFFIVNRHRTDVHICMYVMNGPPDG